MISNDCGRANQQVLGEEYLLGSSFQREPLPRFERRSTFYRIWLLCIRSK